jgi:hypothetical protein
LKHSKVKISDVLERLYGKYNHRSFIKPDPLQFVYKYSNPRDTEIAGFLAAELAYGRVRQIEKDLNDLFGRMDEGPYAFVRSFCRVERKRMARVFLNRLFRRLSSHFCWPWKSRYLNFINQALTG